MRNIDDIQEGFQHCYFSVSEDPCSGCPYYSAKPYTPPCVLHLHKDVLEVLSAFGYLKALSSAAVETIEALMGASPGQYCSMCSKAYTPECDRSEGTLSCTPKWKENRSFL